MTKAQCGCQFALQGMVNFGHNIMPKAHGRTLSNSIIVGSQSITKPHPLIVLLVNITQFRFRKKLIKIEFQSHILHI